MQVVQVVLVRQLGDASEAGDAGDASDASDAGDAGDAGDAKYLLQVIIEQVLVGYPPTQVKSALQVSKYRQF